MLGSKNDEQKGMLDPYVKATEGHSIWAISHH